MGFVCIYGGGNIAHSLAAIIAMHQPVTVVTRKPELWASRLHYCQSGKHFISKYDITAIADVSIVNDADFIFIALPQFAIAETVKGIVPYLKKGATIFFVPAPAMTYEYKDILIRCGCNVVGFQRVPFISRIIDYGRSVFISEPRNQHRVMVSHESMVPELKASITEIFGGEVQFLSPFMTFAFSNSNPLLHPARIVELLKGGDKGRYDSCPYFYAQWTNPSSELYIAADIEMYECFKTCDPIGACKDYESVMDHYCSGTSVELTEKIRSIQAFKDIMAPWVRNDAGKWVPNFTSRYFTEDIPFGTRVIQSCAKKFGIKIPTIDYMIGMIESFSPEMM